MLKNRNSDQIIFFDGICILCNHFVDFILKHDHKKVFYFAPIQGKTAQQLLNKKLPLPLKENLGKLETIYYYRKGVLCSHSDAVLKILYDLGGVWRLFYIFLLFPKKIEK